MFIGNIGNIEKGNEIAELIKSKIIGAKVIDVKYDYFAECMVLIFDNGQRIYIDDFNFEEENEENVENE